MKSPVVQFFEEGSIGIATLGCLRESVVRRWGSPDHESARDTPKILKYGPIQLSFLKAPSETQATLKSIELVYDADMRRGKSPDFQEDDPFWSLSHLSEREFRDLLRSLGVTVHSRAEAGRVAYLFLPGGMRATFENDELRRISQSTPSQSEGKQISAFVSAADLEAIHAVSKQLGISISGLCSRWISEGLHKETAKPAPRLVKPRRV